MEVLDRIVAYEHYYRAVYGHYTRLLGRVGFTIPREIAEVYEIRADEASQDRLLLTAVSEIQGRAGDFVAVDHRYRVQANFRVPEPRPEFLKAQAERHLRVFRELKDRSRFEEKGIYQGYFAYELKEGFQGRMIAKAHGLRFPVKDMALEFDGTDEPEKAVAKQELAEAGVQTAAPVKLGEHTTRDVRDTLEEAYLAQQIFRGETGRYARNWSELSEIASFKFQDQADLKKSIGVPFSEPGAVIDLEAESPASAGPSRGLASSGEAPFVIEPISESQ